MIGGVGSGDEDSVELSMRLGQLVEAAERKRELGVDEEGRIGNGGEQVEAELGFAGSGFAGDFGYGSNRDAALEEAGKNWTGEWEFQGWRYWIWSKIHY